jgi:hypothetical protein
MQGHPWEGAVAVMEDTKHPACEQEDANATQTRATRAILAHIEIIASRQTARDYPKAPDENIVLDRDRRKQLSEIANSKDLNDYLETRDKEIVRDHKFNGMEDYWTALLSKPKMKVKDFARLILSHALTPLGYCNGLTEKEIFDVLRHAVDERVPFIIEAVVEQKSLIIGDPLAQVNFEELRIPPLAAAQWIASSPYTAHVLLPAHGLLPSLRACRLEAKQSGEGDESTDVVSTGLPGRPTSKHLLEPEMRRRATTRELLPKLGDECKYLAQWLLTAYPKAPHTTAKTIENSLRDLHRKLKPKPPK